MTGGGKIEHGNIVLDAGAGLGNIFTNSDAVDHFVSQIAPMAGDTTG